MTILDQMIKVVEGHWTQGIAVDPTGKYFCLLGALGHVSQNIWSPQAGEASNAIATVVAEQYPDRVGSIAGRPVVGSAGIIQFNDHEDTTEADVISVLEKAAARLEESN